MIGSFYEFFCGGGMARLGLGSDWHCLMANDIDIKKAETYIANFGNREILMKDVYTLQKEELLGSPTLAWASFPCQDLSLAGNRSGLSGKRSGVFWGFWSAINALQYNDRAPPFLVLENVCGTLTSNGGNDFKEICEAISLLGYSLGAFVVDGVYFVPQSRPRVFFLCVDNRINVDEFFNRQSAASIFFPQTLLTAVEQLPSNLSAKWRWWKLPVPKLRQLRLEELIEQSVDECLWHSKEQTEKLLNMMSAANLSKVNAAIRENRRIVGTLYKRTRIENGSRIQRAEVRFDGIAGCLRTPGGGSSRQSIVIVEQGTVRSRLLTVREASRLMGVPEDYKIPQNYNDGYHVFGDGLVVPVVEFIKNHLLNPMSKKVHQHLAFQYIASE